MNLFYDFAKLILPKYFFPPIAMRLILLMCIFTVFMTNPGEAQNIGKISGVLKDTETGEYLIGCNVSIIGTNLGAVSDADGAYFILNIPPGKYDVQASMVGYQKVLQKGVIVNTGKTTVADFKLKATAVEVGEVVIEATRPDVEKEKTSTSAIVRFDDVQQMAGMRDVGDIIGLAADVTDGHFRGGREGEEYYTLQGMGIVNPLDNSTAFLPIMSAVEEVEVITSGFGAQYGNAQSGVVNVSMKEGKSDKWRTRFETRSRAPGKKHFGGSVYDPSGNKYLTALLNANNWFRSEENSQAYYQSMTSGMNNMFAGDTLIQYQVARTMWEKQMKRDLYRKYGTDIDYSVEGSADGPIDENMRMFLALRSNNEWPTFPTEQPNIENQIMGNIVTDISKTASLRMSGGFTQQNTNVFPSSSGLGYFNWLWDRITAIDYRKRTNLQLGAKFTHTLSPSTFYEIKFSSLWTKNRIGSTPAPEAISDSSINWNDYTAQVIGSPDGFYYLRGDDDFRTEHTRTVSLDASFTSQVTKSHLITGGIQGNSYDIDVDNILAVRGSKYSEKYHTSPFEGALYLQDKMEFEGMIANVGVRYDLWDVNTLSYPLFPEGVPDTSLGKSKTPVLSRVQPRIGFSFPVSISTVFHLNYGSFMQRPSFQYLVSERRQKSGTFSELKILGNPRLKPETTNSYDVGLTQGLGEGFTLDVSGYYKDVKNLVETATLPGFTTWFNRDYADIRGFRIALVKRKGAFTSSVNYQYGYATGKSATTSNAPVSFTYSTIAHGLQTSNDGKVPVRDVMLTFDRTHNLVITLGYSTEKNWGPAIFDAYPFENLTLSSNSFLRSGRPYTSPNHPKLLYGYRTPAEYNTNVRLTKKIMNFFGTSAMFYFEVFNLFNNKILNYDYIFSTTDASTRNTITANYEAYAIDDPTYGVLYWPNTDPQIPWAVDQSFMIYTNNPRAYNLGFVVEF
jgi:outer membrane receptor protein involved in Fe transport